ncbi:TRAP transporter small permease [Variovorax sp. PCZ-1]|uniref:TRAP transporter small permease n=1 Tax=Variovorax sp. PCZ-1 TaxID=2835533 RepID=UPI001BCD7BD3|nr:TRAP transporter small permease [Variovorax sp. PCZ-1]MBS7806431.1 TRAP transporter small permease [Variovorax sp. PCZ-1]
MLNKLINTYCKLLEYAMALFLALMVLMVFGNVVLRYGFNSGITISEELSRWLFVWVTFMGAVVALKEKGHLGTDMLIARLGVQGKKLCLGLSLLLMLALCGVLFKGAWEQTKINASSSSAAMEISMGIFFSVGLMFAVLGGLIIARDFYSLVTGQMSEADLMAVRESEDVPHGDHK